MSALGLQYPRNRGFTVAAHADYRREHFMFARMQSDQLRSMEWENRLRPLRSWSQLLFPVLSLAALAGAALAVLA